MCKIGKKSSKSKKIMLSISGFFNKRIYKIRRTSGLHTTDNSVLKQKELSKKEN